MAYLKRDKDGFPPPPFKFVIQLSFAELTQYNRADVVRWTSICLCAGGSRCVGVIHYLNMFLNFDI